MKSILNILILLLCYLCYEYEDTVLDPIIDENVIDGSESKNATIKIEGGVERLGLYYLILYLGTPPQPATFIIDSGSELLVTLCGGCQYCCNPNNCGTTHIYPWFDYTKSSSFQGHSCLENKCQCFIPQIESQDQYCKFELSYLEGSTLAGFIAKEKISLSEKSQFSAPVELYCATYETSKFQNRKANGVAGMNGNLSENLTWMQQFLSYDNSINGKNFAICLGIQGGLLNIGSANLKYWNYNYINIKKKLVGSTDRINLKKNSDAWANMKFRNGYFQVKMQYMKISNQYVHIKTDDYPLIDTGTTDSILPTEYYNTMIKYILYYLISNEDFDKNSIKEYDYYGTIYFYIKYDKNKYSLVEFYNLFPNIDLILDNSQSISVFPKSYLAEDSDDWYYIGMVPYQGYFILGMTFLRGLDIYFDYTNNIVRFNYASCEPDDAYFSTKLSDYKDIIDLQDYYSYLDSNAVTTCIDNPALTITECQQAVNLIHDINIEVKDDHDHPKDPNDKDNISDNKDDKDDIDAVEKNDIDKDGDDNGDADNDYAQGVGIFFKFMLLLCILAVCYGIYKYYDHQNHIRNENNNSNQKNFDEVEFRDI